MQIAAMMVVLLAQASPNIPVCGRGADCVELGRKFAAGDGRPVNWKVAGELFRRACERGEGEGCVYQRLFVERGLAGAGAEQRLRASCEGGAAEGCTDLGKLLELRKDLPAARPFYEQGCTLGDVAGCEILATNILTKRFGEADPAKADALFTKACDAGDAFGCAYQGLDAATGSGVAADPKRAVASYKHSCELGSPQGCYYLGFAIANGMGGTPSNAGESRRLFRKACDAGYGLSCLALGQSLNPGSGKEDEDVDANRFFKRACNDVTGMACTALGKARAAGIGGDRDEPAAKALFDRACSLGDGEGCALLGGLKPEQAMELYKHGCDDLHSGVACESLAGKVENDQPRRTALLNRACELGKATACTSTGQFDQGCQYGDVASCLAQIKKLGDTNPAKLSQLMFRACFLKDAETCYQLATNFATGKEHFVHQLKANVLFEMACNLNHAAACAEVANVHLLRQGVAYDPVKAFHLYTQSCDLGDVHGCKMLKDFVELLGTMSKESCGIDYNGNDCNALGLAYIHGIGQPHDLEKARAAFEKSCNLGDHRGCANFATISTGDYGGRADWAKAHEANEKECVRGDAYSCSELAFFWETGRGVKADRKRADVYYRMANEIFNRGCQANDPDACEALATNEENGRGGPANKVLAKTLREKACGLHPCSE